MVETHFAAWVSCVGWLGNIEPWPRSNSMGLEFIRKDGTFLSVLINLG